MSNENENIKAEQFSFRLHAPFTAEDKKRIYPMMAKAMMNFRELDLMWQDRIPDSVPNAKVKRAIAMASSMAEFVVGYMEQNGLCVNLDDETMQGMLTPLLIIAPAIACDSLDEISKELDSLDD